MLSNDPPYFLTAFFNLPLDTAFLKISKKVSSYLLKNALKEYGISLKH